MTDKIKKLINAGVTAITISKGIGVDKSTISKWLNGERTPNEKYEEKFYIWLERFKTTIEQI